MARIRLSTTVNAELLTSARSLRAGCTDAVLIDEALGALLAANRAAEVDASSPPTTSIRPMSLTPGAMWRAGADRPAADDHPAGARRIVVVRHN